MLEFIDVRFAYQGVIEALSGVSLKISEGEVVAIMGENGAGKTTLLKHLNGLLKPTSGDVYVDGINTKRSTVAELARKVGVVFQSSDSMFFCNNVWEEVAFALKNFGYNKRETEELTREILRFMGLLKYSDRSPFSLSGGEKKRLSIAIILAWRPKYIAIDEPTVGQDPLSKKSLAEIINKLSSEGRSIIISTHDVEFVAEINPRVVMMSRGKIVADGPAESVLSDEKLVSSCSLSMPQLCLAMKSLSDLGVRKYCSSVKEAAEEIVRFLNEWSLNK